MTSRKKAVLHPASPFTSADVSGPVFLVHLFVFAFIAGLPVLLFLAGCGMAADGTEASKDQDLKKQKDVFAMDTYMTLTAYGTGAEEALDAAEEEIIHLDRLLSTGMKTSEVSQINDKGEADVSEDTAFLIERSRELYEDTDGTFDITIYPLMKAWGFTDRNYRVPEEEELKALMADMGADGISVESGHVQVAKPGMEIDLGGIAKGYTSQRVIEIMSRHGIEHAIISLGGNVHTKGTKPDGSMWRVAIEDPEDQSGQVGIIEVKDKAVITSGGYERYFEEAGKTYHHIIDPSTGRPADSGLTSVTVVSGDGTLADGLSTALFIMGKEKAVSYWRDHRDAFDMVLVEDDGTVSVTDGIADDFSSDRKWKKITI